MELVEYIQSELTEFYYRNSLLYFVGLITLIVCSVTIFRVLVWTPFKLYFLAQVLPGVDFKKLGRWAIITGGSDGVGKEYAKALAERGLDIILISRSADKLSRVADEINEEHGVKVRTITADFNNTDIYERIREEIQGLDVGVLVNNVGCVTQTAPFLQVENRLKTTTEILHVNCVSMTNMCAIVLPDMLAKNKGAIINVSSVARVGFVGGSTYSASKAYVSRLSNCLQRTYKNSDVIIQTLEPGMVSTHLLEKGVCLKNAPEWMRSSMSYTTVSVKYFVKTALNTLGWAEVSNGCPVHYFGNLMSLYQPQASSDNLVLAAI